MEFNGKYALITGGSSGIGLAAAEELARRGAHVCLLARDTQKLEAAKDKVTAARRDASQKIDLLAGDVSKADQIGPLLKDWQAANGTPDLVINSAGVTHPGYFESTGLDIFEWMMSVNYFGTVNVIKAVIDGMIARRSGYIANISSVAGMAGIYGYSAYGSSKFAVRGLTETLRTEMKRYGIRFSVIYPADTDTPQLEYEHKIQPPEMKIINGAAGKPAQPKAIAMEIVDGIAHNKFLVIPGSESKLLYTLYKIFGNWVIDQIVSDGLRKVKSTSQSAKGA